MDHFLEDPLLLGKGHLDRRQIVEMFLRPRLGAGVTEVVPQKKTLELLAGPVLVLLRLITGSQQIAHRLILGLRHGDGRQLSGAGQAGELIGVASVGFDALARGAGNFGGRRDAALQTVAAQKAAERIAVRTGLVPKLQPPARMGGSQFLGQAEHVIVCAADQSVAAHLGGVGGRQRHGDGLGVDIQADEQSGRTGGRGGGLERSGALRLERWDRFGELGLLRLDGVGLTEYVGFHGVCFHFAG